MTGEMDRLLGPDVGKYLETGGWREADILTASTVLKVEARSCLSCLHSSPCYPMLDEILSTSSAEDNYSIREQGAGLQSSGLSRDNWDKRVC
jgi:hypothetical protein